MSEWFQEASKAVMPLFAMYGVISFCMQLAEYLANRRVRKARAARREAERQEREERLRKMMEDADDTALRLRLKYGRDDGPRLQVVEDGVARALARKLARLASGEDPMDDDAERAIELARELEAEEQLAYDQEHADEREAVTPAS
jgi:hypothetical protein